ncbi:hypothetical protein AYI69_g6723 [Smittium culicis]|uniref:SH3 domain-containing protein n=1 Tax=Smittium culicis TaxID=133412 RepID=A0A1R1XXD0_9FUNG|nr:hypothetical protein AYI69_g6723 [Smittium culicis]
MKKMLINEKSKRSREIDNVKNLELSKKKAEKIFSPGLAVAILSTITFLLFISLIGLGLFVFFKIIRKKKYDSEVPDFMGMSFFSSMENSKTLKKNSNSKKRNKPNKNFSLSDFDFIDALILSMSKPRKAKKQYIPKLEDEIKLDVGDNVKIFLVYDDGWAMGKNYTKDVEGAFPFSCLVSGISRSDLEKSDYSFYKNNSESTKSFKENKSSEIKNDNTIIDFNVEDRSDPKLSSKNQSTNYVPYEAYNPQKNNSNYSEFKNQTYIKDNLSSPKKPINHLKSSEYFSTAQTDKNTTNSNKTSNTNKNAIYHNFNGDKNSNFGLIKPFIDKKNVNDITPNFKNINIEYIKNENGNFSIENRIKPENKFDKLNCDEEENTELNPNTTYFSFADNNIKNKNSRESENSKKSPKSENKKSETGYNCINSPIFAQDNSRKGSVSPKYELRKKNISLKIKKKRKSVPISGIKIKKESSDSIDEILSPFSTNSAVLDLNLFGEYNKELFLSNSAMKKTPESTNGKSKLHINSNINPESQNRHIRNTSVKKKRGLSTRIDKSKDISSKKVDMKYTNNFRSINVLNGSKSPKRSLANSNFSIDFTPNHGENSRQRKIINFSNISLFSLFENKSKVSKTKLKEEYESNNCKNELPDQSGITIHNSNDLISMPEAKTRAILLSTLDEF